MSDRGETGKSGAVKSNTAQERAARQHGRLDKELDRGLEESFPGSDPVAVTQPPHSPHDRREI